LSPLLTTDEVFSQFLNSTELCFVLKPKEKMTQFNYEPSENALENLGENVNIPVDEIVSELSQVSQTENQSKNMLKKISDSQDLLWSIQLVAHIKFIMILLNRNWRGSFMKIKRICTFVF